MADDEKLQIINASKVSTAEDDDSNGGSFALFGGGGKAATTKRLAKEAANAALVGAILCVAPYIMENPKCYAGSTAFATVNPYIQRIKHMVTSTGKAFGGYGMIGAHEGDDGVEVIVGFAGTDFTSMQDIFADVKAILYANVDLSADLGGNTYYSAGLGFVSQYLELRKNTAFGREINERIQKNTRVRVVGHSLGGALANLAAVEFANMGAKVLLQTIGSPRVFGRSLNTVERVQSLMHPWETHFNWGGSASIPSGKILSQRMVNFGDLVPHYPSSMNYQHVGNGGIYINRASFWGVLELTREHVDFDPTLGWVHGDAGHLTSGYLNRITQAISKY